METTTARRPAFLYSEDPHADPGFNTRLRLPTLVQHAWWAGNFKWYGLSFLKRKLAGWSYTQDKSRETYESDELNSMEHEWFFNDRLRFMFYDGELAVSFQSVSIRYRIAYLLNEFKDVPGLKSVLDFGCGGGINFVNIASALPSIDVHGFDYTPKRIEYARSLCARLELNDRNLRVSDGRKLDYPDKSFDVTFTSQVLEQINTGALDALREMGRITRRKIVLLEPAYEEGNAAQKLYILHQDYLRDLGSKIRRALPDWTVVKREKFQTYSNPLEPIVATVLVPAGPKA